MKNPNQGLDLGAFENVDLTFINIVGDEQMMTLTGFAKDEYAITHVILNPTMTLQALELLDQEPEKAHLGITVDILHMHTESPLAQASSIRQPTRI